MSFKVNVHCLFEISWKRGYRTKLNMSSQFYNVIINAINQREFWF